MKKTALLCFALLIFTTACSTPNLTVTPTQTLVINTYPSATIPINTLTVPTESSTPQPVLEATEPVPQEEVLLRIVPEESTVYYEVGETFLNQNNRFATTIGQTSEVNGEIYANPANPLESRLGAFLIDISTFKSDNTRRDNAIRRDWLESSKYPLATFVPRSITDLPETYVPGEPYTFEVQGELTVKQTTLGVTFTITALYDQEQLTGTAETEILMSDFKVGPISIGGVLNTEDKVKIRFDFVARPK